MNRIVKFPFVRILIATLFVSIGIAVGQMVLNLLRSALSIQDAAMANLLAFLILIPSTYFAYRIYVRSVENAT